MKHYTTVSEALNDLYKRGYTIDFSLLSESDCIYCHNGSRSLNADEFVIDEVHRFEGETDPGDEMVIFAISSTQENIKGTLLNAYGIYSDSDNSKIVEKLNYHENKTTMPIKRAKELVQLSREHYHGLRLCWKIKMGLSKNIETERIKKYINWFYENYLLPHFEVEEKYLFPRIEKTSKNRDKALAQHKRIRQIIEKETTTTDDLIELQNLINDHTRFEERVLFNEIQEAGLLENQEVINELSKETKFCENESDPFWK